MHTQNTHATFSYAAPWQTSITLCEAHKCNQAQFVDSGEVCHDYYSVFLPFGLAVLREKRFPGRWFSLLIAGFVLVSLSLTASLRKLLETKGQSENILLFKAKPALRFNNVLDLKEMKSNYLEVNIF